MKLNIHELPADPEERSKSLTAKAEKLQQNIDDTENEDLKEAFTTKYRIVTNLTNNPLSEQDGEAYRAASEKRKSIATKFFQDYYSEHFYEKIGKTRSYLDLGIYPKDSQEYLVLGEAVESLNKITHLNSTPEEKVKGAAGYLKREKRVNQVMQNVEVIIQDILAEARSIKASSLLSELRKINDILGCAFGNEDYATLSGAFLAIRQVCESQNQEDIIQGVCAYRHLKEKLPSLLESYPRLINETPSFVSFMLSGERVKLEERILRLPHITPDGDMYEFLSIVSKFRDLPSSLKRYYELESKLLPALERAERAQLDSFTGSSEGVQESVSTVKH